MKPNRNWLLVFAGAICIVLVLLGIISFPADDHSPLEILAYSIGIPLSAIVILFLIYFRGRSNPPDSDEQQQ
jgi:O-antigen/teichoic acid export membrane protein